MKFEPTNESIKKHQVPNWFHEAKLGIFIHWGLYSVPAFAVTGTDIISNMSKYGLKYHFKNNPYAEWYLNTLKIEGSPTQKYHFKTYGKHFSYDNFVPMFNEAIKEWNPENMADLFKKIGASYVVLVTRHIDGFLMWHSKYPNPNKTNYMAKRDIVKELTEAVKKRGMKMGFYYCSAWDWTFNTKTIKDEPSFMNKYINPPEYTEYVTKHWFELIDKYEPDILWSDMGYPYGTNVNEIFAYFYNKFPDGIVNDRWNQYNPANKKFKINHSDYRTPEYEIYRFKKKFKWECTRGIGNSFGYNKFETEQDYLTSKELILILIDIVSKNGNLLLNIGPMADGSIPEVQRQRLLDLGEWININGEAIFGTHPYKKTRSKTLDGIEVRFTQRPGVIYAILLDIPKNNEITIKNFEISKHSIINLIGYDGDLYWKKNDDNLTIVLPENIKETIALALKVKI